MTDYDKLVEVLEEIAGDVIGMPAASDAADQALPLARQLIEDLEKLRESRDAFADDNLKLREAELCVTRLRKAVNWLRGALHDEGHAQHCRCPRKDGCFCSCDWAHSRCKDCPPHEHITVETCDMWECQRSRDILSEDRDNA